MKFKTLLGNVVLVEMLPVEKYSGSIILPDVSTPHHVVKAKVIKIGVGYSQDLNVGDIVLVSNRLGTSIELEGFSNTRVYDGEDILAKLEKN